MSLPTHHPTSETFRANALAALADDTLRGALQRATGTLSERRKAAIAELPEWDALRARARAVKAEVLSRLDHYLEEFVARAQEAGATVHWARDGARACAIVAEIAAGLGRPTIVKSKSMTTEEIHLNEHLERGGLEPVETDLGEWIIQLAGEMPSHITAPAIHKTRGQIARLFVEKIGSEPTDDVQELTLAARKALRRHFAAADLGISGVNFAVAETGSILILENEGNIRLTTSLPRVHVAVMGIEKVIPRFSDLELFLRLLPRSGTGQHLSGYQSILTGPPPAGGEGPAEMHIVLLDNGRSAMLREEVTRQSLACIRCGACLNFCPVYQQIGGHAYGSVYPGPIGAVITPQLNGLEKTAQLPFASSLCGACRDVCPVEIDIPRLLLHLRALVSEGRDLPGFDGTVPRKRGEALAFRLWAWAMTSPRRYRAAAALARLGTKLGLSRLAPPVAAWRAARELRPFASRSFRDQWRELER